MKKRTAIIAIILLCFIMAAIIAIDYYRSIYVSSANAEDNGDELFAEEKEGAVSDVFLQEETAVSGNGACSAKLCFFGDNLIHENVLNYANLQVGAGGSEADYSKGFDFKPLYKNIVPLIESADFSVCNQASLVAANDAPNALSGYPLFNSPSVLGDDLISLGIDGINIGNNHLLDMGIGGLEKSVSFWRTKDVALFGGYLNEKEKTAVENKIVDVNGIKIAFLSYTANTNGLYSENGTSIPYFTLRGTEILRGMLEDEVSACKKVSDLVVVMINWENSAGFDVTEFQKKTAEILSNAGADVIVGSGPKTIQPIEWLTNKDNGGKTLCAYSLGNFMGTMQYTENLLGGALSFEIQKDNGEIRIENVMFHPTVIHYNESFTEISVFPLEDYTPEQFSQHGSNLLYGDTPFETLKDTVKKCISSEFLAAVYR